MSFDEQPDGDIHGECAAEIHRLEQQNAELVAALTGAEEFVNRHSEPWYMSGQQLLTRIRSVLAKVNKP